MRLSDLTKKELARLAVEHNIANRSAMTKNELAQALEEKISQGGIGGDSSGVNAAPARPAPYVPPVYNIPRRYQIDTAVLLPVNPRREYVYWEISDASLSRFKEKYGVGEPIFVLKLFCIDDSGNNGELASVRVGTFGSRFFDLHTAGKTLWAEIGAMDARGNYYPLIHSRKIKMPGDRISETIDEETWMTVGEKIEEIYRLSGAGELGSAAPGSARLFQEMLRYMDKTVSSAEIFKRGEA